MTPTPTTRPFILFAAGGHAKVLLTLARALGLPLEGVCDPELAARREITWQGLPVLGDDTALADFNPAEVYLINGIGQTSAAIQG